MELKEERSTIRDIIHKILSKNGIAHEELENLKAAVSRLDFKTLSINQFRQLLHIKFIAFKNLHFSMPDESFRNMLIKKMQEYVANLAATSPISAFQLIQSLDETKMDHQLTSTIHYKISLRIECLIKELQVKKSILEREVKLFNERELTEQGSSLKTILVGQVEDFSPPKQPIKRSCSSFSFNKPLSRLVAVKQMMTQKEDFEPQPFLNFETFKQEGDSSPKSAKILEIKREHMEELQSPLSGNLASPFRKKDSSHRKFIFNLSERLRGLHLNVKEQERELIHLKYIVSQIDCG